MSAFIVDNAHISAIIRFAAFHRVSFYHPVDCTSVQITRHNATEMGRILLAENIRSVNHRYREQISPEQRLRLETYRCPSLCIIPLAPVAILKAIDCLDYQSCETDDWRQTPAFWMLQAIKSEAIAKLPGYSAAAWHITD